MTCQLCPLPKFVFVNIKAIQEQQEIIEAQESEIEILKNQNQDILNRLEVLENK